MRFKRLGLILMALMIAASSAAEILRPRNFLADLSPKVDFEQLIPEYFGEWKELPNEGVVVADPVQKLALELFYSQTVSRVYVNQAGYKIMLSIAYGKVQTDSMRVHSPEVCYPAQGFLIISSRAKLLDFSVDRSIPVTFAIAKSLDRVEPMTYLVLVGNKVSAAGFDRKLAQLEYGFKGIIPDGLLIRVSSIDSDNERAEKIQRDFLTSLYGDLVHDARAKIFGLR